MSSNLELDSAYELHNARPECRRDLEEVHAVDILALADEEVGPVEEIERFGSQLNLDALLNPDALDDRGIDVKEIGTIKTGTFDIAGLTRLVIEKYLSGKCWLVQSIRSASRTCASTGALIQVEVYRPRIYVVDTTRGFEHAGQVFDLAVAEIAECGLITRASRPIERPV